MLSNILQSLYDDQIGIVIVSLYIVALFAVSEWLYRKGNIETELTRKLVHFGAGLLIFFFPWLMHSLFSIALLAFAFVILLVLGKITGWLSSVHNVSRKTGGAYYYPIIIVALFWLSKGSPPLFCIPISVLALADSTAALVGKKWGENSYVVYDGHRTFEGSGAFFIVTFLLSFGGLSILTDFSYMETLYLSIVIAIFTTALEGVCILGLDNLLIPYGVFLILAQYESLGVVAIKSWIEGMLICFVLIFATAKRLSLTIAGALSIFITGSIAWGIGKWQWSSPLIAMLALILALTPIRKQKKDTDLEDVFPTTLGSIGIILLYAHSNASSLFLPYITALSAGGCIAMIRLAKNNHYPLLLLGLAGSIIPVLPVIFIHKIHFPLWQLSFPVLLGWGCFYLVRHSTFLGRRLLATTFASALCWLLGYLSS